MAHHPLRSNCRALGGRLQLQPHDFLGDIFPPREGAEATIGPRDHALLVAHHRHRLGQPSRHYFRVLDEIGGGVQHAGHQQHVRR